MCAKVDRGGIALFDVELHDALHGYLSQWSECMPVEMQVIC